MRLSDHGALPVVDAEGRYLGTLTARAVAEALAERPDVDTTPPAVAGDLAETTPPVTADMPLSTALHVWSPHPVPDCPSSTRTRTTSWAGSPTKAPCACSTHPPPPDLSRRSTCSTHGGDRTSSLARHRHFSPVPDESKGRSA